MVNNRRQFASDDRFVSQSVTRIPQGLLIQLRGELRSEAAEALAVLFTSLASGRDALVVFDLSGVTLLSSLAMGQLVAFRRGAARHGTRVALAQMRPEVEGCLRVAGLEALFEFFATTADALNPVPGR